MSQTQVFDTPMDADRRVHERHGTGETGTLWHLGLPFSCVLRNVSVGGALLDVDCEPSLGAEVILETSTLGRQQAQVVRVVDEQVGVRFQNEVPVSLIVEITATPAGT